MPIPKFDQLFLPVLQVIQSGEVFKTSDLPELILQANYFNITDEERAEQTPSGANLFNDRVSWAKSYLKQGKYVSQPSRGVVQITEKESLFCSHV